MDQLLDVLHFSFALKQILKDDVKKKKPRCDDIIEIVISQGIFIDTKSSSPMLVWILTTSQIPPWHFRLFAVILVFFFHPF